MYQQFLIVIFSSTIVGVTTFAEGCDREIPGVYAKITEEAKTWIKSVAPGSQDSDCDQGDKAGWRPESKEEKDEGRWRPVRPDGSKKEKDEGRWRPIRPNESKEEKNEGRWKPVRPDESKEEKNEVRW